MRAFLALPIPLSCALALSDACAPLRAAAAGWRLIRPGDMHLTLAFLGDVDRRGAEGACLAARRAIGRAAPGAQGRRSGIDARARGLVFFPPRGLATVLAAGLGDGAREIAALADGIERELERVGAETGVPFRPRERRPFLPHVTLARARRPGIGVPARGLAVPLDCPCRLDTVALYRSEPGPGGPRYEALELMTLG